MKLSTRCRYGLKAVVDIAMHSEEAVSLSSVAKRQEISISYLEQLIARLKKAGIVNSIRGSQGGYVLAKPTQEISIGEILRVLEGDLNPVDCVEIIGGNSKCSSKDSCVTKLVWKRITDSINDVVDNLMLSDLLEEGKAIEKEKEMME